MNTIVATRIKSAFCNQVSSDFTLAQRTPALRRGGVGSECRRPAPGFCVVYIDHAS